MKQLLINLFVSLTATVSSTTAAPDSTNDSSIYNNNTTSPVSFFSGLCFFSPAAGTAASPITIMIVFA